MKNQKIFLIGAVVFFSAMILLAIFFWYQQSQMGRVVTVATPKDLTLTLDGTPIAATGQFFVTPGKHELFATRRAFTDKKIEFEIAKGETKEITVYIFPDGSAGDEWIKQNPDQASVLDGIVSNDYENQTQEAFDSYPILSDLPIVDRTFRISHGQSQTGKAFALYIQAGDQTGRDDALATLRYYGYDPANYEIIYTTPN